MPKNNNPAVPGSHTFVDPDASSEENRRIMQDPATDLATKRGQFIEIYHIPSGESVVFKAYIGMMQMCMVGWILLDNLPEQKGL